MPAAAAVQLWRFGRDGSRIGRVRLAGPTVHREEIGGEDAIELRCLDAVEKYDRLLWRDPEDGRWREHVAVRIEEELAGACAVRAESSLCDLLAGYIVEERLSGAPASEALAVALEGTGWTADASGLPGDATASCLLYHANRLAALRRVCVLLGCEAEPEISVSDGKVSARTVRAVPALGSWRGARLERGRNMAGCARTVLEDEVFTALYGYGAGLPAVDEDGTWIGGYRRKLTIGAANGGIDWVGDEAARLEWGLPDGSGGRAHRFGEVTFPEVEDPEVLLAKTQQALAEASRPRASYEVDAAALSASVPVGLGDEVAVIDSSRDPEWRVRARVLRRMRRFGDAIEARYTIGTVPRTLYAELSDVEERASRAEDAAGWAGDVAASVGSRVDALEEAAGVGAGGEVPELATKEYVDAALAALGLDVGLKMRALLLSDGTLEFNYRDGRSSDVSGAVILDAWEVDPAGYSSASKRPWHGVRLDVARVVIDADFAEGGLADASHLFNGFQGMTEVRGFEALAGVAAFDQAFASCGALETIYARGYAPAVEQTGSMGLHGCYRLVGAQGWSPNYGSGVDGHLNYGEDGALTDPESDAREWVRCHLYADGELVFTLAGEPETGRELAFSGRMCATARYRQISSRAWDEAGVDVARAVFSEDVSGLSFANLSYWFYGDGAMASVEGLSNLPEVREMRYAFSTCDGLTELDLAGFPTHGLTDLFYCFSGCSNLATIWADADWALPGGCEGQAMFYGCDALVGGAGTAYAGNGNGVEYFRIDGGEAAPGYLTAKTGDV